MNYVTVIATQKLNDKDKQVGIFFDRNRLRRWVVNASPLILLGKIGRLGLLFELADAVVAPRAVISEIAAKPDGVQILHRLSRYTSYFAASDERVRSEILSWDLGAGETQVVANAQLYGADRLVLDDMAARRCAMAMGFNVIGTLGVVGRAKHMGKIERAAPIIERLRQTGLYVSEELVRWVLHEVGE
uniref:Predicted nucleic acid-binding protein, contains PIN domain n=1 Tax=Candidatus Kentrum sp. FM TaxID=2126340 RepID=A0A450SK97_9GAMM|nr:MAG: Predicted nucleic acid-binding protein, contains PIN domain [Candidatus Kentron sp. FM]VFJ56194.1 MAG: Predicted nucleic acid-binding protein, contains PIN domain [Candidatus Kentron sp. FM]